MEVAVLLLRGDVGRVKPGAVDIAVAGLERVQGGRRVGDDRQDDLAQFDVLRTAPLLVLDQRQ